MIEFEVNNGQIIQFHQPEQFGDVEVERGKFGGEYLYDYSIPAGDFVMLLNLYRYIKDHDIQNDFINPNGKNKD